MSKGAVPSAANENRFDHIDPSEIKQAKGDSPDSKNDNIEVDEDLFGDDDLGDIDAELGDMALDDAGMT